MIYSTRHKLNGVQPMDITNWAPIVTTQYNFWDFMDAECATKKLEALGIDPKFLNSDAVDFDYEAGLNEFLNDYNTMFPEADQND
jgi:hypothetical protein